MVGLRIEHNGPDMVASIRRRAESVPGTMASALRRAAFDIRDDLRAEMRKVFDRPAPWTINSLRILSDATRDSPVVVIGFRDFADKGTAAGKYLAPQIEGGPRTPNKRSERALLRSKGRALYLIPTDNVPVNQYGNVRPSYMVRVLSAIQGFGEEGFRANRTAEGRRRAIRRGSDIFAIYPGTNRPGLAPGIYERRRTGFGWRVIPLFVLTDRPPVYQRRFDFWGVARRSAGERIASRVTEAFSRPGSVDAGAASGLLQPRASVDGMRGR